MFLVLCLGLAGYEAKLRWVNGLQALQLGTSLSTPAPQARWPWPKAKKESPRPGVTHWLDRSSSDGTVVELIEFDFKANPRLYFALFDQDSDDAHPWDDHCQYWNRAAGQMTAQLNHANRHVVALWNGLFYGYHGGSHGVTGDGQHVAPVVQDGKVHSWGTNHRWSFGVKYVKGRPHFKVLYLPSREVLAREFDFGGGSAQCLVKDGKPLRLQPFPASGDKPLKRPVPCSPQEAGHIPDFDHMRSCRASLGWSKDSSRLYLLFVKEPDSEAASILALRHGGLMGVSLWGGWTVADLQRFWLALRREKGIENAINSDAGDVAQLALLRSDGDYFLVPSRQGSSQMRMKMKPDFKGAPSGGGLMYFYVVESTRHD